MKNKRLDNFLNRKNVCPLTFETTICHTRVSRLQCAVSCQVHEKCMASSYDKTLDECFLHVNNDFSVDANPGWDVLYKKQEFKCDYQWNGHCYFFSMDKKNWTNAQEECFIMGSNLVKIETATENVFIVTTVKDLHSYNTWIGASDLGQKGSYVWALDSSQLEYTDWAQGEPTNGEEDCVIIWSDEYATREKQFHWNDNKCIFPYYFVCEKNHLNGQL